MHKEKLPAAGDSTTRQVRLTLRMREFELPPVDDGIIIGKRAAIGPVGLFEAIERMLPGTYELIPVEGEALVEAVILRKSVQKLLERKRLIKLLIQHADALMSDDTIIRVDIQGELSVNMELEG